MPGARIRLSSPRWASSCSSSPTGPTRWTSARLSPTKISTYMPRWAITIPYRTPWLNLISQEQISLFKTFVGNQNIPDNHVLSYFDVSNPKVVIAANKYFKNIYGTEYLTLYYYYPTKAQSGTKIHKFRFTSEISDLFMGAQNDYLSMVNPRLILENGKEIVNDRKIKCIGALNLSNNSKIKVLSK